MPQYRKMSTTKVQVNAGKNVDVGTPPTALETNSKYFYTNCTST